MIYFSLVVYLITFLGGFILDKKKHKSKKSERFYIVWLFIFLCFGYMTGSDWRGYELDFELLNGFSSHDRLGESNFEFGFWSIFYIFKVIFADFFLVIGLLKALYLLTLIKLLKSLTNYYLSAICCLMPLTLCFMLIDNPLRFMTASILLNLSLYYLVKNNFIKGVFLIILSVFVHNTCIIMLFLLPFLSYYKKLLKFRNITLFIVYLFITYMFSDDGPVGTITSYFQTQMMLAGGKDYSSYLQQEGNSFLTIGSFLNIFLFLLVLYFRKFILSTKHGELVFSCAIVYFFLFRLFVMIPSGTRLTVPLSYFVSILFAEVINKSKQPVRKVLFLYLLILFSKYLWTPYVYIPYSNSIPYIITTHKPYLERSNYNFDSYKERMGKDYYDN